MLNHSNTLESKDFVSLAIDLISHEKKSSEDIINVLSVMMRTVESHSELISGLISMSEHSFSLGSFAHVLQELHSQSEDITQCLSLLAIPAQSDGHH